MEKRTPEPIIRIVITGPESTGKTTLALALSGHFNGCYIPEHARAYVEQLDRPYTFDDVCHIADEQVRQYQSTVSGEHRIYFFDTWLVLTKVWFDWVYHRVPERVETNLRNLPMDLYLLCVPDLPWEPDPVRENGGETRLALFRRYRDELLDYGFPFVEISGEGEERLQNAVKAVDDFLKKSFGK